MSGGLSHYPHIMLFFLFRYPPVKVALPLIHSIVLSILWSLQLYPQAEVLHAIEVSQEAHYPGVDPARRQQDPHSVPDPQIQVGVRNKHPVRFAAASGRP